MTQLSSARTRYSTGAIILHWLMAILIITNLALAFYAEDLPKPAEQAVIGNHKAIGIMVLALAVLRIVWRITHPAPPLESTLAGWERTLAKITHTLFYVLIIAVPLAGWLMVSPHVPDGGAAARPLGVGVPALPVGKAAGEAGHELHEYLALAWIGLIVLHIAGAWKHQLIDKDGTMGRMIPFLRR